MPLSLLQLLRHHREHWLTMDALQSVLRQSPERILSKIEQLRNMGHRVESAPALGFRLIGQVAVLTADLIEYGLSTERVGRKILVYEVTDSTNDVAWAHAGDPETDGLVVFAEYQRLGRGRLRRRWSAPPSTSLLVSVLLREHSTEVGRALTLLAGLATAQAVEEVTGVPPRIKWPNDITVSGRKLAGIMVESRKIDRGFGYVIGIGINCQQTSEQFAAEVRHSAISLRQLLKKEVDRLQLAQRLLVVLEQWLLVLRENHVDRLHQEWLSRCDDVGHRLNLIQNGRTYHGRVIDVSPDQGLWLQLDEGAVKAFDPATTTVQRADDVPGG